MAKKKRHLQFDDGTSSKFWEIVVDGASHTVRFGRIGTDGQKKTKDFSSTAEAQQSCDRLIQQKTKKGYREVSAAVSKSPKKKTTRAAASKQTARPLMQKRVVSQIEKLGGRFLKPRNNSLETRLQAIRFPHVLYDRDWDVYGIDRYFKAHRVTYKANPKKFYDELEAHYFTNDDTPRGQSFWCVTPFTPLTPETADFDVWSSIFEDPTMVDLQPIRELVGEGPVEFLQIMSAYGFPDCFYVCLQDPKPGDPTVFGTDHEDFFREFPVRKPLSEFLKSFLTKGEFLEVVREYIEDAFT
ncbi:MAG: hypothetical protein COA78_15785 [Blastopirellula sp.]|nr:MAG: hypothetical protein COA78_15785 [Blastopirellula sp.]